MVPLLGVLRYTHRCEIAVGEPRHTTETFAARSSESLTVVVGGCVKANRASPRPSGPTYLLSISPEDLEST